MAVAERIAEARKRTGMTQAEAASRTKLGRAQIARIETGAHNLTLQTLARLAITYGVRPDYFFTGLVVDPILLEPARDEDS